MTREQIKQKILSAIDEVCDSEVSNLNIERPIETFLDESAMQILYTIPVEHIENKLSFKTNEHQCNSEGCGWVKLPEKTVRVTAFKIKDWNKTITQFSKRGSYIEQLQSNNYLRGGVEKPVVIIDADKLYYYSARKPITKPPEIEIAEAITLIDADERFPEKFVPLLVWLCASKVLQIMNDLSASDRAALQYNNLMLMFS